MPVPAACRRVSIQRSHLHYAWHPVEKARATYPDNNPSLTQSMPMQCMLKQIFCRQKSTWPD